jgi:hypothetical protein
MKKLVSAFVGFLFLFMAGFGSAEVFRFKYHKGDTYRILSTVSEDVKINGKFDHHAEIVNRVGVVITETMDERARHEGRFMTTETKDATSAELRFDWGEEYESVFTRDQYGKYTISAWWSNLPLSSTSSDTVDRMRYVSPLLYLKRKTSAPAKLTAKTNNRLADIKTSFFIMLPHFYFRHKKDPGAVHRSLFLTTFCVIR